MKRVLQIVTLATPGNEYGGPLRVAVNQSKFLRKIGYHVDLISARDGFDSDAANILFDGEVVQTFKAHHPLGKGRFAFYYSPSMIWWLIKNLKNYDLVHCHFARDFVIIPATLVAIAKSVPFVLQTHGMVLFSKKPSIRVIDRLFTKKALARASRVLSLAEDETQNISGIQPTSNVSILPNGIDPASSPNVYRKKNQVLFLARLHPRKRPLVFVEIARRLAPLFPESRFLIAGPDAGQGSAVEDAIRRLDLGNQLEWLGSVPPEKTQLLFDESLIYVLPAIGEIFPMAILEAFKSRTAVVATSEMFIADFLTREEAALITNATVEDMASAVESLLRSPELRRRVSTKGELLVQNELNIRQVVEGLSKIYDESSEKRVM